MPEAGSVVAANWSRVGDLKPFGHQRILDANNFKEVLHNVLQMDVDIAFQGSKCTWSLKVESQGSQGAYSPLLLLVVLLLNKFLRTTN